MQKLDRRAGVVIVVAKLRQSRLDGEMAQAIPWATWPVGNRDL